MTDQASMKPGATLGILQDRRPVADIVSEYDDKKRARYHLQRVVADIMQDDSTGGRLLWCGRRPVPLKKALLVYEPRSDRLYKKNFMSCNLGWLCPVCSARITGKRRRELSEVISTWPGSVIMGAFTVGHHAGDELTNIKKIIDGACRGLLAGRGGQAVKHSIGIVGTIQANEVTWSQGNGWHPHRHVLFFTDQVISSEDLKLFQNHVRTRFAELVTKNNGYTVDEYAVNVTLGRSIQDISDYCFKWGVADELLAFQSKTSKNKKSFTPFELADLFGVTGDQRYRMLFREYARAFRGTRRVTYSRGLKGLLGLADKSDQALLKEVETVQVIPSDLLPEGADVVQIVADFTTQAVKAISIKDQWDVVMDVFRRSVHKELTFIQVGVALASLGVRVVGYGGGMMGVYSEDENPPRPSSEVLWFVQRVEFYRT